MLNNFTLYDESLQRRRALSRVYTILAQAGMRAKQATASPDILDGKAEEAADEDLPEDKSLPIVPHIENHDAEPG